VQKLAIKLKAKQWQSTYS